MRPFDLPRRRRQPLLAKADVFVPFDPVKKTSEATATGPEGRSERSSRRVHCGCCLTAPSPRVAIAMNSRSKAFEFWQ